MIVPIPGESALEASEPSWPTGSDAPTTAPREPRYLVRTADKAVYGPARLDELQVWRVEGRIVSSSAIQTVGSSEWVPADKFFAAKVTGSQTPGVWTPPEPTADVADMSRQTSRRSDNTTLVWILAVLGLFVFPLAIVAVVIGYQEMGRMDRGETDPSNRSSVQMAVILALIFLFLNIFPMCCCCLSLPSFRLGA
jgi:hypothetical protein